MHHAMSVGMCRVAWRHAKHPGPCSELWGLSVRAKTPYLDKKNRTTKIILITILINDNTYHENTKEIYLNLQAA